MDLAQAHTDLQRRDTGAKFYVPPSYYEGVCSWDYCSWWTKISTPYLSQSVEKVHQTTMNKNEFLREAVYIFITYALPVSLFLELLKFQELRAIAVLRRNLQYHPLKKEKSRFLDATKGHRRRRIKGLPMMNCLRHQILVINHPSK